MSIIQYTLSIHHKSLNGLAPGYMQDMFKYVTDVKGKCGTN